MITPALDSLSMTILQWVLQAVFFGSALALCTWALLSTALRGARPALHAAFWILVLVKFLAPQGPSWEWSLSSLLATVTPAMPAAVRPDSVDADLLFVELAAVSTVAGQATGQARLTPRHEPVVGSLAARSTSVSVIPWVTAAAGLYLVAVAFVAAWRIRAYRRFAARCRRYPPGGRGVRRMVSRLCRLSGVRRAPLVRLSDDAVAPFIFGLLRPTLVLSRRTTMSEAELEAVLLHEIAHLRRFDLITRYVQWLAGTVLFFWPVVAWVNRRIDLAREHACDEWALRHGRLSAGEYARCLLAACSPRTPWSAYRPAAMAANMKHVERRIDMILELPARSRSPRLLGLGAGLGAVAWGAFALTGATAATTSDETSTQTTTSKVVLMSQDGQVQTIDLPAAGGGAQVMMLKGDGGQPRVFRRALLEIPGTIDHHGVNGADGDFFTFRFEREISPDALAAFGARHPAADANGDGMVSLEEHDAYLVALAMSAPESVLEQFPHVDLDSDGELSISEAAQWVTGPSSLPGMVNPAAGSGYAVAALAAPGGGQVIQWSNADSAGEPHVKVKVTVAAEAEGGQPLNVDEKVFLKVAGDGQAGTLLHTNVVLTPLDGGAHEIRIEASEGQPPMIWINGEPADAADLQDRNLSFELPTEEGQRVKVLARRMDDGASSEEVHEILTRVVDGDAQWTESFQQVLTLSGDSMDLNGSDSAVVLKLDSSIHGMPDVAAERFVFHGAPFINAADWLTENVSADVLPEEVAEYLTDVRQAPLDLFLQLHPDADYDGDGVLTERERARYLEAMTSRGRQAFLERHPEADADGDGLLTDAEMRAFITARRGSADSTPPIMRIMKRLIADDVEAASDE